MTIIRRTTENGKTVTEVLEYKGPQVPPSDEPIKKALTLVHSARSKVLHSAFIRYKKPGKPADTACNRRLDEYEVVLDTDSAADYERLAVAYPNFKLCQYCFLYY